MSFPMSFIWPAMLFSLLLMPLFVVLYLRVQRRRQRLAASYSSLGVQQDFGLRHYIPPGILLMGLTLLLFALARPQIVVSLPRTEGTVILAFDVSRSMAADDLQPTRLEAAKAAAQEFVQQQPASVLIGVVAFSDNGFVVQAPTTDQEAVLITIERLVAERGTSLANGILAALNMISARTSDPAPRLYSDLTPAPTPTPTPVPSGTVMPAVIVLLTDGENNETPDPLAVAETAADRGVRIYTIGIGSASGTTLDIEGFTVHTQLNETLLQQVSQTTNGAYYSAESEQDLRAIYDNLDPKWVVRPEEMEVTSILAGASILALLIGGSLSLVWLGRLP
jgi:Ca-activated chloride channel family protein